MEVEGTFTLDGKTHQIKNTTAWFDRQWGFNNTSNQITEGEGLNRLSWAWIGFPLGKNREEAISLWDSFALDAQYQMSVIGRMKEVTEKPTVESWGGHEEMKVEKGNISFENLTFAFRGKEPVIRGFDMAVKPGEKVALVGESGCGKTTLAYLLLGFYQPAEGKLRIDGRDISEFTLESIHKNIGVVQQDVLIFNGTVRENIMIGNETATEKEMIAACRAAGVYEFIMELPDGFETLLGTGGRQLSGGQKQRISIARVYLKNPAILIFDEATASLDNETEALIHDAWKSVLKNRTAIIIAHRQSAVELCDRVVMMKDGGVFISGTPAQLKESSEEYRTLFALS